MTGYTQVYEAVPKLTTTIGGMAFGIMFVCIGLGILLVGAKRSAPSKRPVVTAGGWIFLLFSLLWTAAVGISGFTRWHAMREGLDHGKHSVIAGRVEDMDMSLNRYPSVWFTVTGQDFRFHGRAETAGFRGPQETWLIQPGQEVRLSYVCQGYAPTCIDPIIVRAEVRKSPDATP